MSLLAPAALALGLLAVPIILLYMLRLRRREELVSSTLLWQQLVRDQAANAPWQRLRRNLLLFLQLLILAALVAALARPVLKVAGLTAGRTIVLLDASASMQATDGGERPGLTRYDAARDEVAQLIAGLSGDNRLTLIHVGRVPTVLAADTNDRRLLLDTLSNASVENAAADWNAALALAGAAAQGAGNAEIVIVSDGGLQPDLPGVPADVRFIPVGTGGENLAVSSIAARPDVDGTAVLVGVSNHGQLRRDALASLYIDGTLYDSRRISVDPDAQTTLSWNVPARAGIVEAVLEPADGIDDLLPVDNRAQAVIGSEALRRVLLVSEGNLFLERLFSVLPGYELYRVSADELSEPASLEGEAFDLYVYDNVALPDPLPDGPILVFSPQPTDTETTTGAEWPGLSPTGDVFTETVAIRLADNPLLEAVDWRNVSIEQAMALDSGRLTPLVESEGGPLILTGEQDGQRAAVFTFDLRRSDLPLQVAFPILMANITTWLSPGQVIVGGENALPGSVITLIPDSRADTVIVERPDGSRWEQIVPDAARSVLFSDTQMTGLYNVSFREPDGRITPAGSFAVNLFLSDESRVLPGRSLQLGTATVESDQTGDSGRRELWPWFVAAAFVVLLVEWWLSYSTRRRVPALKV